MAIDEEKNLWQWTESGNPEKVLNGVKIKKVSVAANDGAVHIIDEDGNLWGWGNNNYGQLGDGNKSNNYLDVSYAKRIANDIKFKEIYDVGESTWAIDKDGNLWSWGRNYNGQLGNGGTEDQFTPVKISQNIQFEKLVAETQKVFAIDKDGNLYSWGYGSYGFGDGTNESKNVPTKILNGTKFVKAIGSDYTQYALDINANLWGWGNNDYDQFGIGNTQTQYDPIKVMEGTKVKEICGSRANGIIVDENDNIYFYGQNDTLKYNTGIKKIGKIPNLKQIVWANYDTMLAIDENGNRWGWGDNDYGELGNGTSRKVVSQLTKID